MCVSVCFGFLSLFECLPRLLSLLPGLSNMVKKYILLDNLTRYKNQEGGEGTFFLIFFLFSHCHHRRLQNKRISSNNGKCVKSFSLSVYYSAGRVFVREPGVRQTLCGKQDEIFLSNAESHPSIR